jgi:hypothetical protein
VEESKPVRFKFAKDQPVTKGRPTKLEVTVYSCEDPQDAGAPKYPTEGKTQTLQEIATAEDC